MSDPQQPSVPPSGQPSPVSPPAPPATHLPATPQYPAAPGFPTAPQAYPTAAPGGQSTPTPGTQPAPQAYPTAAPAYPTAAQGYPVTTQGTPVGYAPFAPAAPITRTGNPLGRVAFVIALVTLAVNLLSSLARPFFYTMSVGYEAIIVLDNVIGIISFFVYGIALVLGVIAVRRAGSQVLAGVAIGIAGAGMLGLAFTLVTLTFYRFF
ncbi:MULTISPECIES: hypothetical protein [unclassified Microbacterium]|uniref:hypothetical protein n=1 Tax=unclassified Microbacterium TaxID=2609290 RepID=UPI003016AD29